MAAATYYDEPALQQEKPQFSAPSGQQSAGIGNQEHGTQGLGQEMHQQEQRNFPQQGYNEQSNGVYAGQQQPMGNTNHAQGASSQPMNGNANAVNGGQAAAKADDRDTITKWLDRIEKKFGGDRFNNPENEEKNRKLNENVLKRAKQVGMMVMQRGPQMLMNMVR